MTLSRSDPFMTSDEDQSTMKMKDLYCESCFTDVNQNVEKSVIDYFGVFRNGNQTISDIAFIGALRAFNVPLIKDSWCYSDEDFLKLPPPTKMKDES